MKKLTELALLALLLTFCSGHEDQVRQFVNTELKNYPEARLTDIYKNFFQDAFGPGHMIPDTLGAGRYLDWELQQENWVDKVMFQELGIHHDFIRVNLSLVRDGIIPRNVLLEAMVKSAPMARKPGMEEWKTQWREVMIITRKLKPDLPEFRQDSLKIDELLAKGEVAIHHSEAFEARYHPHYRIIHRTIFETWRDSYLKDL